MSQEETEAINGGTPVTASGTTGGSAWTFSGDMSQTLAGTKVVSFGFYSSTDYVYTTDYTGVGTMDGNRSPMRS